MEEGQPPPGLTVAGNADPLAGEGEGLTIVRRPGAGKRAAAAAGFFALLGLVVALFVVEGTVGLIGCFVIFPAFVAFAASFSLLRVALNRTEIVVDSEGVRSRQRPFRMYHDQRVWTDDVAQLLVGQTKAAGPQVYWLTHDGKAYPLVLGLDTVEQAWFVERALERALGLTDRAVRGELRDPSRPAPPGPELEAEAYRYDRVRLAQWLWWSVGFAICVVATVLLAYFAAERQSLGELALGAEERSMTVDVPPDRRHLAFMLAAHAQCEGPHCTEPSTSVWQLQWWEPPFALVVTVLSDGEVLWAERCDASKHAYETYDRYRYDNDTFSSEWNVEVKVKECAFEVPEAGRYEIRARLEPIGDVPVDGWNTFASGESRVRIDRVVLSPGAYQSEAAAAKGSE